MIANTPEGVIRTVTGEIPAVTAGITLIHEHLRLDATRLAPAHGYAAEVDSGDVPFDAAMAAECRWNPGAHPDNYRFDDTDAVLADLLDAASLGVRTVVDCTPIDLGRSPGALQELSRLSNVNVVMGTGFYLAATHQHVLTEGREEELTFEAILRENSEGVGGVRPGIIGEIGTSDPPLPSELAVLRGAARAAQVTGLCLTVHIHPWGSNARAVVATALDTGLPLERLILNHMSTAADDPTYLRDLLKSGATLGFDLFGFDHSLLGPGRYPPSDDAVAECVSRLAFDGFTSQIVLSQDVGVRTRLRTYGGWGYGHLMRHVVPLLESKGVDGFEIRQMLVENTRRLLTIA
jgi:phosphotriesterase-related protein